MHAWWLVALVSLGSALLAAPKDVVTTRPSTPEERARYAFLPERIAIRLLDEVARTPAGFVRIPVAPGSFGAFVRGLPVRAPGIPVRSFAGETIAEGDDPRVFAVAELDVGRADLQQCADSVIRLHAEWLWSRGLASRARYRFVSGDLASFASFAAGDRPVVDGNRVRWERRAKPRTDRTSYRAFLDVVFAYASTLSLAREMTHIERSELAPGDAFVAPGSPGHAVMVLDVARDARGRRVALLGQGYMPAQDFHVLASGEPGLSPWFSVEGEAVPTPFWPKPFAWSTLRRFVMPTASSER
jgi:hypothetical protein